MELLKIMRKLYKLSFFLLLSLPPIIICICLIVFPNNTVSILIAASYLLFIAILIVIFSIRNYESIKLKLGIFPVYHSDKQLHGGGQNIGSQRVIAFVGDSVTYGFDDDNQGKQLALSWPEEVHQLLSCPVVNCGVSSASLLPIDSWTPIAWATEFNKIPSAANLLGVMIGINDCFRKYPIGDFKDREANTFYGGLHTLIKGLQLRFPAHKGNDIFLIIYPNYDADLKFKDYIKAIYEVAEYYSVPICDLSIRLGASSFNDPNYLYWRKYSTNNYHTPHPTQITSHLIAKNIANYINYNFLLGK